MSGPPRAWAVELLSPDIPVYEYVPIVLVELQPLPEPEPEPEPDPDPESVRDTDTDPPSSEAEVDLCKLTSEFVASVPVPVVWPTAGCHWRGL